MNTAAMTEPDLTGTVSCRFCRSSDGELVLDAGLQPASDLFPLVTEPGPDPVHPLRMWLCGGCGLAQLIEDPTVPEEPRGKEPDAWIEQAKEAVADMAGAGLLAPGKVVFEYGSPHGGDWMDVLLERGLTPAASGQQADVIIDNIGMMHDADQAAALRERVDRLAPEGVLLFQFHSFRAIIEHGQWNALRHGHYAYYSTPALVTMLASVGLTPVTAFRYSLYGGTVLLAARRGGVPDEAVARIVEGEKAVGVLDPAAARTLQEACSATADELHRFVAAEKAAGRTTLGYSAASRSVALLNRAGIGPGLMSHIADAAEAKAGRRLPGSEIPIISPDELVAAKPDTVVLFVPDLLPEVRKAMPQIEANGGRWVVAEEMTGSA